MNRPTGLKVVWVAAVAVLLAVGWTGCKRGKHGDVEQVPVHDAPGMVQNSGCQDKLNDICFPGAVDKLVDPQLGFAVGVANTMLKTTDGGLTWRRMLPRRPEGPDYTSVIFAGATHGWILSRSALLYSTDGGERWGMAFTLPGNFGYYGPQSVTKNACYQMQAPTYSAAIYKTIDDGSTWTALKAALPRNDYEAVFFLDDRHSWVVGQHGDMALTLDGGDSWQALTIPDGGHMVQVQFVTPLVGWIRSDYDHQGGILHSEDGGKTWRRQNAMVDAASSILDMQFLDEQTGFLLVRVDSFTTRVLRTLDGGASWEKVGTHHIPMMALCFVNPCQGWVVGDQGCIFRYNL